MVVIYIGFLKYSLDNKFSKLDMPPKHAKTFLKIPEINLVLIGLK